MPGRDSYAEGQPRLTAIGRAAIFAHDMPAPPTELDDWRALTRGERPALERLYRAHAPALLQYGSRFAGADAVEDAVHDLFVRLWQRHATLTPDVQPRPYLLIALRNDLLRAGKRAARLTDFDAASADAGEASAEEALVLAEAKTERAQSLNAALATLSPRERELVELRFGQSLDYEAIVEVTGISYQSARNTLARAIGKLRTRVALPTIALLLGTNLPSVAHLLDRLPL